jgi:uncharacterized protein YbjT (DUF2867 family)
MILVTGATGMFGGGITAQLAERGAPVRAMARNPERAKQLERPGVEPTVGDMDRPDSLDAPMQGVDTVFVVSPMDDQVQVREGNVLEAARRNGVRRIVKLYGAVRHEGDPLGRLHDASVEAIKSSGLQWALISPTSVMETTLLSMLPWIENAGGIVACSGEGRVALVAAADVARAGAVALAERDEDGANYVITGPQLMDFAEMCQVLGRVTDRSIPYWDVSDEDLADALVQQAGMTPEQAEIGVVCHFRAWRQGGGAVRTDTYRELTGEAPTTLEAWAAAHRDTFAAARDKAPAAPAE